jgi:hypothetical protein
MIDRDTKPIAHIPPYKRVDLSGRPRVITREQIEDNVHREPCSEAYRKDCYGNWTLKD